MKKIIMLCPFGISLWNNIKNNMNEDIFEEYKNLCSAIHKEIEMHLEWDDWSKWGEWKYRLSGIISRYDDKKGEPTAELTSTINWLAQLPEAIHLEMHIFPSKSEKSVANAYATQWKLEKYFNNSKLHGASLISFHCKYVHVDVRDKDSFDRSVDELFSTYNNVIDNNSKTEIVINATGGYKSISAYSVLYAQLKELPSIYNFEEARTTAFELLPLPISYALDALDEEMNMLRTLEKGYGKFRGFNNKSYFRPWLRSLIQSDSKVGKAKEERQVPKALITMFLKHHAVQKARGGAYGSALLDVLREKEKEQNRSKNTPYYNYLVSRIANEWSELWMGDQIPETVEHSRQHSKRLMELASYLYRADCPKLHDLKLDEPFCLALLISTIYLHDIGHTALVHPIEQENYPGNDTFPLGLFPSCVREVHHLLSAEFIRSKTELFFPEDDLATCLGDSFNILRILTPLVSEHHRGYTRLKENKGSPNKLVAGVGRLLFNDYFEMTLLPLKQRLLLEKRIPVDLHEKILRVVALLRVLDGCDVQADRVVGPNYIRARMQRTRDEALPFTHNYSADDSPHPINQAPKHISCNFW